MDDNALHWMKTKEIGWWEPCLGKWPYLSSIFFWFIMDNENGWQCITMDETEGTWMMEATTWQMAILMYQYVPLCTLKTLLREKRILYCGTNLDKVRQRATYYSGWLFYKILMILQPCMLETNVNIQQPGNILRDQSIALWPTWLSSGIVIK